MGPLCRVFGVSRLFASRPFLLPYLNLAQLSTIREPIDGEEVDEPDVLIKKLELEVRGHEPSVLKSYENFVHTVCGHFDLQCKVETRNSPIFDRLSLNKSPFIYKKHQRQYEFRTYVKTFTIPHLTGSTASVFLEYIQRNLPAGVHMTVNQHRVEPLPEALQRSTESQKLEK
ncbi:28S ribosomal protein S10, mitochondrial [Echinococcus granulosus]|uniref:Small ribosomal subunit protein uS10m n=1 Tax=Echinococcus granulosus TaxID=6210 RepID=A0A068WRA2_ECHGR|nr:28S ribosomal protein S10, mitochondrial [Echinococcus granulosus]CDS21027.1 28S ribosomal protein S10 mitochondrial [Echinococcus granulosus]